METEITVILNEICDLLDIKYPSVIYDATASTIAKYDKGDDILYIDPNSVEAGNKWMLYFNLASEIRHKWQMQDKELYNDQFADIDSSAFAYLWMDMAFGNDWHKKGEITINEKAQERYVELAQEYGVL